jgi:hypothetical protein
MFIIGLLFETKSVYDCKQNNVEKNVECIEKNTQPEWIG